MNNEQKEGILMRIQKIDDMFDDIGGIIQDLENAKEEIEVELIELRGELEDCGCVK